MYAASHRTGARVGRRRVRWLVGRRREPQGPVAPADVTGEVSSTSVARAVPPAGTSTDGCHIHPGMQGTVVVR
jgi:hypothetical protein